MPIDLPHLTGKVDYDVKRSIDLLRQALETEIQRREELLEVVSASPTALTLQEIHSALSPTGELPLDTAALLNTIPPATTPVPVPPVPPPPQPPPPDNHLDVVIQAKADLVAAAIDLSGDCGGFEITKLVAWRLKLSEPTIGLLFKDTGTRCSEGGIDYSIDRVMYQNGVIVDVVGSAGVANVPQWNVEDAVDPIRWREPIQPAIPE